MQTAFFGSSLVSAYWNGAATYYRGIIKALRQLGHEIVFYEPDAFERQAHRDMNDPEWARVVVYSPDECGVNEALAAAKKSDLIIKASGVGVFDSFLEEAVAALKRENNVVVYWDVDAPATLERLHENPDDALRKVLPQYDMVLTYGGGPKVVAEFLALNARKCIPVYNALDPDTHFPVNPDEAWSADLTFLGNRLPDRESRVENFFFAPATGLPEKNFLLGGNGWKDKAMPGNVRYVGHVYTSDHNRVNSSCLAVLNINRESMARYGFSPPTRIFEAAGAGACIISDSWPGIEEFLEPGKEILVADSAEEVVSILKALDTATARSIGRAALSRVTTHHTYAHRASQINDLLESRTSL